MKRLLLVAVLAAAAVAATLSFGSSHREAPNISLDPTADNTDVYAFVANDAPNALTVIANWIPLEEPAGGPNFYNFDDRARYYINIDNTGDGRPDVRYLFQFKTRIRNKNTTLYAVPPVNNIRDRNLNIAQTYSVVRETFRRGKLRRRSTLARSIPVAPNNTGPKTFPNYDQVASQAIGTPRGGGRVFAGQRDEAFYIDLGTTFDAINLRRATGNEGGGKDDTAGLNVHSIALQVPKSQVTSNGRGVDSPSARNAVVGVWSSTERRRLEATRADFGTDRGSTGSFVQVSRLGNPLINELIIPLGQKDEYNRTQPKDDVKNFGKFILKPEPAALLNQLFNLGVKENNRTDLVTALVTGLPGATQIAGRPATGDTLKINMGVPPNPTPNRFGALAGDMQGFPNGRRLGDDMVDITLRVVGGFLVPENEGGKKLPLGDGVDQNDKPFLSSFPYIPGPTSGFDSDPKRNEPTHEPTPGQP